MKNILFSLIAIALFTSSQNVFSQYKNQLVNSGEIFRTAYTLYDSSRFDLAIDTLLTIDKSDTGYVATLTELAYSYMMAKKYREAINTCNKAMSYPSPLKHRLTLIKGNTLDDMGSPDSAILLYKEALKKYPFSYLIYYNLAITYANKKQYSEAVTAFQEAIKLNPFHSSSHLGLGKLMARMGQYAHAILSLETFLMTEPSSGRSNPNLVYLNNFVNNAMGNDFEPIKPVIDNEQFAEIDQLIKAGIALNEKFKAKIDFNAPINKQTQLLIEALEYKPKTGDFWMEYYVPIFIAVKQNNHTEDLIYNIMSTVPDKKFASQVSKRQKSIKTMNGLIRDHLSNLLKDKKLSINGKEQIVNFYLNDNNGIRSYGHITGENRKGYWKFFHNSYETEAEGEYNENGKLNGIWKNYDENGNLTLLETYTNGELDGEYTGYYPSGNVRFKAFYKNGNVKGDVTYYYDCNAISSVVHFENNSKNGKSRSFYTNGKLMEEYSYLNDSLEGENKAYYPDGTLKWVYYYKNNKLDGKTLNYHDNGQLLYEYVYKNGLSNGPHKTYHYNGKVSLEGDYKNGNQVGLWKEYNDKGILTETSNYNEKGMLHGENKGYDGVDGKCYYIFNYDNGKTKEFKYLDKNGNIFSSEKLTDKKTPIKGYYADGHLFFEGFQNKGKMDGTWIYYYKSGVKQLIKNYVNGELNGTYISFDNCGRKVEEANYTNNELDGYYKKYHATGKVNSEGWYVDGSAEGKWYYWYPDGKISKNIYYLADQMNGFEESYAADQKIQFQSNYKADKQMSIIEFDPSGNEVSHLEFDGKHPYILHYFDHKVRLKCDFSCNTFNSSFQFLSKTGKIEAEYNYLNGSRDGKYFSTFENGNIKREGSYKNGKASGIWKYYFEKGGLFSEGSFVNDDKDSIWTSYYENKKIKSILRYKNDLPIDTSKYYDSFGEFMYSLVFNEYGLQSYQYLTSNGLVSNNINPKDTGTIVTYYKNGKPSARLSFKYGVLEGKQTSYFSNGNKYQEYNIVRSKYDGPFIEFFENGKTKLSQNYLESLKHGTFKLFRPDGTLEKTEDYRYDDEHGSIIYYDTQGKKTKEERYWGTILLN